MANNRIFLVHVPSGLGVALGKRMAYGWYTKGPDSGLAQRLDRFYDMIEEHHWREQDSFALALEDGDALPMPRWVYGEMEGEFRRFQFVHTEPVSTIDGQASKVDTEGPGPSPDDRCRCGELESDHRVVYP